MQPAAKRSSLVAQCSSSTSSRAAAMSSGACSFKKRAARRSSSNYNRSGHKSYRDCNTVHCKKNLKNCCHNKGQRPKTFKEQKKIIFIVHSPHKFIKLLLTNKYCRQHDCQENYCSIEDSLKMVVWNAAVLCPLRRVYSLLQACTVISPSPTPHLTTHSWSKM